MRHIKSLSEAWFNGGQRSRRDLYALGVLAIAMRGYRVLVVPGIVAVLVLASLAEGGWLKRRSGVRSRCDASRACGSRQRVP